MTPTPSRTVRAATLVAPETLELREYPYPAVHGGGPDGRGGGVLRVELCALCGTDYSVFRGEYARPGAVPGPLVPGHEVVGIIEDAVPRALECWGVAIGDRVVVEPNIGCGVCGPCATGQYVSCAAPHPMAHGFIAACEAPGLWGGYAEVMYLSPRSIVHAVPAAVDSARASLCNVVANGFEWVCNLPGLRYGQSVLVLGAGQRGLAAVAAARASGAGTVIATGLSRDSARLAAAMELGADATIEADSADVVEAVRELTGGAMVDVALDCTPGATRPVIDAVRSVAVGGTVVLSGLKHGRRAEGLPVDEVVGRRISIIGALSSGYRAYRQALAFLGSPLGAQLAGLRTHELALGDVERALRILGGEQPDEHAVYVSLAPGR
ncbi:MAG TPA: zinc-binding dehydrogenase [Acidimicrobiales bacterium]|nr:zinc-binding dehydrogenase [Acidimicrobiales bacterium]